MNNFRFSTGTGNPLTLALLPHYSRKPGEFSNSNEWQPRIDCKTKQISNEFCGTKIQVITEANRPISYESREGTSIVYMNLLINFGVSNKRGTFVDFDANDSIPLPRQTTTCTLYQYLGTKGNVRKPIR